MEICLWLVYRVQFEKQPRCRTGCCQGVPGLCNHYHSPFDNHLLHLDLDTACFHSFTEPELEQSLIDTLSQCFPCFFFLSFFSPPKFWLFISLSTPLQSATTLG